MVNLIALEIELADILRQKEVRFVNKDESLLDSLYYTESILKLH